MSSKDSVAVLEGEVAANEQQKFNFISNADLAQLEANEKKELWLTFADLGPAQAKHLFTLLANNRSVSKLNLNGNALGNEGAAVIARLLTVNTHISDLNLAGNGISDKGAILIAKSLEDNRSLQSLCLLGNRIGNSGALAIGDMLRRNSYLQHLYLYLNDIGDEGALAIAGALSERNKHLVTLWLDHNPITLLCCHQVISLLAKNRSLINLELTVMNELMAKEDQQMLKILLRNNQLWQQFRSESAKKLMSISRNLLSVNLTLPIELLHQILFSDVTGFDSYEEATLSSCLLNRSLLGCLTAKQFDNNFASLTANELIRRCQTINKSIIY